MGNDRTSPPHRAAPNRARGSGRAGRLDLGSGPRSNGRKNGAPSRGREARSWRRTQVVIRRGWPWGMIAASVAVAAFAATAIGYAVVKVNRAEANKITLVDQIRGIETFDYAETQEHVATTVEYQETPPVGGPHDTVWADCTGTVYTVDIRNENAVHSLEHGAAWITYDPERLDQAGIDTLSALVEDTRGTMLSPRSGLETPVMLQAWNNRLKVESAGDPRVKQFVEFLTFNPDSSPEPGASCDSPAFAASPQTNGDTGAATPTDLPTAPAPGAGADATDSGTP